MLKEHGIASKSATAVLTCGLHSVIRQNTVVLKPPVVKRTDAVDRITGDDSVN